MEKVYKKYYRAIIKNRARVVSRLLKRKLVEPITVFQPATTVYSRIVYFKYQNDNWRNIVDLESFSDNVPGADYIKELVNRPVSSHSPALGMAPVQTRSHSETSDSLDSLASSTDYLTSNSTLWTVTDEPISKLNNYISPEHNKIMARAEIAGEEIQPHHSGSSALSLAVQCKSRRVFRVLLKYSAPPETPDYLGEDSFYTACRMNDPKSLKMLVKRGYTSVNREYVFPGDKYNKSFIHYASSKKVSIYNVFVKWN